PAPPGNACPSGGRRMSGAGRYCGVGVRALRGNDADRAITLRPDGQSLSLDHRCADRDPAAARLADARHPSRPDAWRGDDRARLDRDDDPAVDHAAVAVAADPPGGAGSKSPAMAAGQLRAGALAALPRRAAGDIQRMVRGIGEELDDLSLRRGSIAA